MYHCVYSITIFQKPHSAYDSNTIYGFNKVKYAAVSVRCEPLLVSHARHHGAIKPITPPTQKSKVLTSQKDLFKGTMFIFRERLIERVAPLGSRKTLPTTHNFTRTYNTG
jgi:hypothetical protein